jgi:hypothetical protein
MYRMAPWCGGGVERGWAAASSWREAGRGRNGAGSSSSMGKFRAKNNRG